MDSFLGNPLILEFMASWCPECERTDGVIKEYRLGADAVKVISVGVKDTAADLRWFAGSDLDSFFLATDSEKVLVDYHLTSVPIFFFIDASGVIQFVYQGENSLEELKTYAVEVFG